MAGLKELRRAATATVDQSIGAKPLHGARPSPPPPPSPSASPRLAGVGRLAEAATIPHHRIAPDPDQPRAEFDPASIELLAATLAARGQLQPIRVRWDEAVGKYVLISGERRWRAAAVAGLATMACVIHDGPLDAADRLLDQVMENACREDLRPMEEACAFRTLMELQGWSGAELARELGIGQSRVSRALALLGLPEGLKAGVESGAVSPATAYEVSKVKDPTARAEVAARVVVEQLGRDQAAELVRRTTNPPPPPPIPDLRRPDEAGRPPQLDRLPGHVPGCRCDECQALRGVPRSGKSASADRSRYRPNNHTWACNCTECSSLGSPQVPADVAEEPATDPPPARPAVLPIRQCRVCGCTEEDSRGCIEKTGEPCRWVTDDLCSACLPAGSGPLAHYACEFEPVAGVEVRAEGLGRDGKIDPIPLLMALRSAVAEVEVRLGMSPGAPIRGA